LVYNRIYKRDKNYGKCIKEIFREIKGISEFPSYAEYHVLRNVLEHQPPYADWGRRFNELFSGKFAYTYTPEPYTFNIDFDYPQNKSVLQEMSSKLIYETRKYLNLM
jgi:hypothetical protein